MSILDFLKLIGGIATYTSIVATATYKLGFFLGRLSGRISEYMKPEDKNNDRL